jgi:phosphomannomutase
MLMRSISGIRGIVGEGLKPDVILNHVGAFLLVTGAKSIVIGRDARSSGQAIENLISSYCLLHGVDVISLGLATTPTVEIMVKKSGSGAGIIVTASHNGPEWNALKFLNADGTFLIPDQVLKLLELCDQKKTPHLVPWNELGRCSKIENSAQVHIDSILSLSCLSVDLIRQANFKVACDMVNGAASEILPQLLRELGCEVYPINNTPDGTFPRGGEPLAENLSSLESTVKQNFCDVGFATDPDADRCALVGSSGVALGEEYTLALAIESFLLHKKSDVAVNLSTSLLCDSAAERYKSKVFRTAVGEINVSDFMRKNNLLIGGEGNGGTILAESHLGRDSLVAVVLTLNWMAKTGKNPDDFKAMLPEFIMEKRKLAIADVDPESFLNRVRQSFPNAQVNEIDGLHLMLNNEWIHLRKSNTEPIFRIITESAIPGRAKELADLVGALLNESI